MEESHILNEKLNGLHENHKSGILPMFTHVLLLTESYKSLNYTN